MKNGMSRKRSLRALAMMATIALGCGQAEPPARPQEGAGRAAQAAISAPDAPTITLDSPSYRAVLSAQGAALVALTLKDERYERDGEAINLVTTDKVQYLPLRLGFEGLDIPADAVWTAEQIDPQSARFTLDLGEVRLVRKFEVGDGPYQLWSTLRIHNAGERPRTVTVRVEGHHYARRSDEEGNFLAGRSPLAAGAMCVTHGEAERFERAEVVEDQPRVQGDVAFGSVDTVFFAQAIAAEGRPFERCVVTGSDRGGTLDEPEGSLLTVALYHPQTTVPPGSDATLRTLAYLGPKLPQALAEAGHGLPLASHVGGLPGINGIARGLVALLAFIHDHLISNWGVAIIVLTVFVKLLLYPLTAKSFQSIAAMRQLKPAVDEINQKYADDREKKGAAMMELYRKHKISPFGGCLPQLLQLPIWWALYMSLSTNVALFKRPFFWFWQDLAAPDPYYVLPIGLGVLMFVQQKITPSTMDPAQAKVMLYVMPAMITSFMLFLPAGLCLYMFTNSALSIGQQRFIEHRLARTQSESQQPESQAKPVDEKSSASDATPKAASPRRTRRGRA